LNRTESSRSYYCSLRAAKARILHLIDTGQYEIDLILDFGSRLLAIEVKLTSSPDSDDVKRFRKAADMIKADSCILISRTQEYIASDKFISTNIQQALKFLLKGNL